MSSEKLKHFANKALEGFVKLVVYGGIIAGAGLLGHHCCYERKTIKDAVVLSVDVDCGTDGDTGIEFCVKEIEIDKKYGCLYVPNKVIDSYGKLKVSDKLEELKWYRGLKRPFLDCDVVDSYKIAQKDAKQSNHKPKNSN